MEVPDPGRAHPGGDRSSSRGMDGRQARDLLMGLGERDRRFTFLIRGRDSRFTAAFGEVVSGKGPRVIKAPVWSPRAHSCRDGSRARYAVRAWITC